MSRLHDLYKKYTSSQKNPDDKKALFNAINEINVNEINEEKETLLHLAARDADSELIQYLLQKKANAILGDEVGFTPLRYFLSTIAGSDYSEIEKNIVGLLIKNGANVDEHEESTGYTGLHWAVVAGNLAQMKILLNFKANVFKKNIANEEPLTIAVNSDKQIKNQMISLLLNAYAGIGFNFKKHLSLGDEMCGKLVLFATYEDQFVTRKINGFEKDITNKDEFLAAIKSGIKYNYEELYLNIKRKIEQGDNGPQLNDLLETVKGLWRKEVGINLRGKIIFYLAENASIFAAEKAKKPLANELIAEVESLAAELAIDTKSNPLTR